MGGYFYGFDIKPVRGKQLDDARARDAFWSWLTAHLERLATRDPEFIRALRRYLDVLGMPGEDLSVSREGRRVGLIAHLEDCSGAAETSMLAALHIFDRLTVDDAAGLRGALALAGAVPVLRKSDRAQEAAQARFFSYRGRIASCVSSWFDEDFEEQRGLAVAWDPATLKEPSIVPVARFPDGERVQLEKLARERRCLCPMCAERSAYAFPGRGLPRFKPVRPDRKENAPWRIGIESRILSAMKMRGSVVQVEWRRMEFLEGPILRAVRKELRALDQRGENTFPSKSKALEAAEQLRRRARRQVQ